MEGSGVITQSARRDPATVRTTRTGVLIASIGALIVVFNPFGIAIVGLVLAVVGAILAARGGLGERPNLAGYLEAVRARPAYQRALARGGPVAL